MTKPEKQIKQNGSGKIVISIDAMGGDHGSSVVIDGISKSLEKNDRLLFLIHGNAEQLEKCLADKPKVRSACEIVGTKNVVQMDEKPSNALRSGKDTSMWSTLLSLRNGDADIAISCGNTGALMAMAMVQLRKIQGLNRPAIAILWPSTNKHGFNVVLDAGADIRADSQD